MTLDVVGGNPRKIKTSTAGQGCETAGLTLAKYHASLLRRAAEKSQELEPRNLDPTT